MRPVTETTPGGWARGPDGYVRQSTWLPGRRVLHESNTRLPAMTRPQEKGLMTTNETITNITTFFEKRCNMMLELAMREVPVKPT